MCPDVLALPTQTPPNEASSVAGTNTSASRLTSSTKVYEGNTDRVTVSACTPAHPAPPLPLAHAPCYTDENTAKMALPRTHWHRQVLTP